jgi:tripartite ATP-independent transporter DctM subunit
MSMTWYEVLGLLIGLVTVLMVIGMPIALAFLAANIVGVWLFMGGANGVVQLLSNGFGALSSFSLVPIPLFLLMGELFFRTGLGVRMFNAFDMMMGKVPGRLSYVTVFGGTGFAAVNGSAMGSTALLGSVLLPEMNRRGYKNHMSMGPILGTGGLAIIIPPSALGVLLATLAKIDIGAFLIAGILPGVLLAVFYVITIWIQVRLDPSVAPAYEVPDIPLGKKLRAMAIDIFPMVSIIGIVVVMLLNGWATPSESAAFGALAVLILALLFRCLTLKALIEAVTGSLRVTLMAFMIVFASATFSQLLAFTGASSGLIQWATSFEVSPLVMLAAIFAVLLVLGIFMEEISIIMLTVPFFFPLAQSLGFDLIWFGIIMLISLQIGLVSPPLGLLLFVLKGVAPPGTTMNQIFVASLPYMACSILLVILMVMFPPIVTWLPSLLEAKP